MPVLKVPIVHKFGIISHSQRLQLQSRLLTDLNLPKSKVVNSSIKKNPFEIGDEFVEKYNSIMISNNDSFYEKKQMNDIANKMLLKIKRRIGIQYNCENETHINVALGWTELSILSQCSGDISNKCLDLLCLSLSLAPISNSSFFVQLYLFETALYYLQITDITNNCPDKHIKWLQIGELVALRIYLQCKLKLSKCQKENIDNIKLYMKDINKCQKKFQRYPEAAISFCVIHEVTEYLINQNEISTTTSLSKTSEHDISSLLWHCADLWNCSFYSTHRSQIQESVRSIQYCLMHNPSFGNWMDCYLSFRLLASVATFEIVGLETFKNVILGLSEVNSELEKQSNRKEDNKEEELTSSDNDKKICGYEKGTLLLLSAVREFACLPLLSTKSDERGGSLSTIAEWLLHNCSCKLPKIAEKIIVARLKTCLEVVDRSEFDEKILVIKNATWSLLETVERKQILKGEINDCLKYGKVMACVIFSPQLSNNPIFINERIATLVTNNIFPIIIKYNPSQDNTKPIITTNKTNTIDNIKKKNNDKRQHRVSIETKTVFINKKSSEYIQQSDTQLNKILQQFWEKELPELEKSIEQSNLSN